MNRVCMLLLFSVLTLHSLAVLAQNDAELAGTVLDATGAVIPGANVKVQAKDGASKATRSDSAGSFDLKPLTPGEYRITVSAQGFSTLVQTQNIQVGSNRISLTLLPERVSDQITVFGSRLNIDKERIGGAADLLQGSQLESARVFNFSEALRKIAGLNVREEEGFGLRPNIGFRGLNPTRSTKVLLLEDGVPFTYAVYGDNASYYHPPVERFTGIEVLKGAGQILYGPTTVGGVVNYITPEPPDDFGGSITLTAGNRNYFDGVALVGGTFRNTGWLIDYMRKQGEGSRENIRSGLNDLTLKLTRVIGAHNFDLKGNLYTEDSNVGYSGLRLDEFLAGRRQNPFRNDFFYGNRHGGSLRHSVAINNNILLATNLYGAVFTRDWWRQSSNSGQRPNDSADPACGGMANLNTTCGNEGRQRQYHTVGIDPHARIFYRLFGLRSEADLGFRAHFEKQYRIQRNGDFPTARSGILQESNIRRTQAYSTFVQNKLIFGKFSITPGVRIEHIEYSRTNQMANGGAGITGLNDLTQAVPGVGVAFAPSDSFTLFGGMHRGFSPPRVEDVISNAGGSVELDPELSWNYEAGFRSQLFRGVRLDATFFRMDYENQIIAASLAGGLGAALTNGGQTLHQGFELTSAVHTGELRGSRHDLYFTAAYTYVPIARFEGARFSNVPGFTAVSVTGNRLTYAPETTLTGGVGYANPRGIDLNFEAVYVGDQFGDDLNSIDSSADGQRGLLPAYTTWNASFNYRVENLRSTLFVTVKNLLDDASIVDRARGILPNVPRLLQTGLKYTW